jgi:4-hydroxy-tetrahydrodipicolinate synthase
MFSGAFTALITPLRDDRIDLGAINDLVEYQISEGIDGLVPCGTTGEAATLSEEEHVEVVRLVVKQVRGRVPVIAGAGSNNTIEAIRLSKACAEVGADALLHVTPYYNKPTHDGLVAHYRAICAATDLPVIAYNVPGRTGCDMMPATIAQLAQIPHLVGVKEATANMVRGAQVIAACPKDFAVLSGDDATCLALTLLGGCGVISVASNLAPGPFTQMIAAARRGDLDQAREIHYRLLTLMDLLFIEANPIPVKACASLLGFGNGEMRLPLVKLTEAKKLDLLRAELARLGLSR